MKKSIHYTIPFFLIIFLINPAFGFAGMANNNSTAQSDPNNITESDQDIILAQHLIEVDAVQLQSENRLLVRETLIFKNQGTKDFSGFLRTWVPDGSEAIRVGRIEMMRGASPQVVAAVQNGNIISWQDFVAANNPLPPLYVVEYMLTAEPKGTISKTKHYPKALLYPTLITKQPGSIVVKVTKNKEESVAITDEKGSSISASGNPRDEGGSILYGWEAPEFKEINVEISKPAVTPAGIAGYVLIGLVIILVLSYPIIRKKSGKIQAIEEKIRNSLKREETSEVEEAGEEIKEETPSVVPAEAEEAVSPVEQETEFEGKTREELENLKTETLSRFGELDGEYESGNLMDEEYEELRKSYQDKLEKINKKIEQPG